MKFSKMTRREKKIFIFRKIPLIMIPFLGALSVISTHSKRLLIAPLSYTIYILFSFFISMLGFSFLIIKKKKEKKTKKQKFKTIFTKVIYTIYILCAVTGLVLLYGPSDKFRTWLISTAMMTKDHQYLCKWFYNDSEINKVNSDNYIVEIDEDINTELIKIKDKDKDKKVTYENEYEEQILKRNKNDKYKIIELQINGQKAYLAAIYDPSKVKVATTKSLGTYGQYVTKMAEDHDAILAINGGGFYDPNYNSTGGCPTGVTIEDGKIKTNNNYSSYSQGGGLIGLTNDDKLIFIKNPTGQKALEMNVRDGITWGPFLIVNGKKSFIKGNGGWGYAARSAIGQRSDGIILLLTVDSNSTRTKGADMVDLTEIMYNYGAVNAANLDGGTSTVMVLPKKQALKYVDTCEGSYCYINDPVNGSLKHRTRAIATSIIVEK